MGLESIIGGLTKGANMATGLLNAVGPIAGLFKPNDDKRSAASLQQILEKNAIDLQHLVESGQMDPEAAIAQLLQMQQQASRISGTPELQQASQRANLIIGNVLSSIKTKVIGGLNSSFKGADGTATPLTGTSDLQKAKLGTGLRNYALGVDNGLQGTMPANALDTLAKPAVDPTARFKEISPLAAEFAPVDTKRLQRPQKERLY